MDKPSIKEQVAARVEAEAIENPQTDRLVLKYLEDGERGDGKHFQSIHRDKYIHDHASGIWWIFEPHIWKEDTTDQVLAEGIDAVSDAYAEESMRQAWAAATASKAGREAEAKAAEASQKRLLERVRKLKDVPRRRNVKLMAAAGHGLTGNEWDNLPDKIAGSNGVINLRNGELRPGRPEDYLRTAAPTEYLGPDAPAPAWERFLDAIFNGDESVINFVQRLMGYAATGVAREHIVPIFYGEGRNGKGTLLETLKFVLGDYAHKAESELLLAQRQAKSPGAPNSAILALRGKRHVWCAETGEGRRLNAARVKELAGGDTLNARGVYDRRHVEFRPTHQIFLMTNSKPHAPAGDYALWQRILLIPFKMAFVDNPTLPHERQKDPDLIQKLQAESSGILAWLVRGAMEYFRRGRLDPPESVRAATEEYRQDEDVVGQFLNECCVLRQNCEAPAGKSFNAFQSYCAQNGYRTMSNKRFAEEMKKRFDWRKGSNGNFYIGVGLLASE